MRTAGRLASEALDFITPYVKPGVTTGQLDKLCHDYMVNEQQTTPAPLNYAPPGHRPYPASICTSVNHQVCHGIPGEVVEAWRYRSTSTSRSSGWLSRRHQPHVLRWAIRRSNPKRLCEITYESMRRGIQKVKPGCAPGRHRPRDPVICREGRLQRGSRILRSRHRQEIHEDPQVLHYGKPGTGIELKPGMIFTVEPMIRGQRTSAC